MIILVTLRCFIVFFEKNDGEDCFGNETIISVIVAATSGIYGHELEPFV